MSFVFVLNNDRSPLPPVHPGTARRWLTQGKAAVFRRYPFTISAPLHAAWYPPRSGEGLGGGSWVAQLNRSRKATGIIAG